MGFEESKVMASTTVELNVGSLLAGADSQKEFQARESLLATMKMAVFTAAAFALYSSFGLSTVLMLCLTVVLGDFSAYLLRENFSLGKRLELLLLALNSLCWIQPILGLYVASLTFGLGNLGMDEPERAQLYRASALMAISTSVAFLALSRYFA